MKIAFKCEKVVNRDDFWYDFWYDFCEFYSLGVIMWILGMWGFKRRK